MSWLKKAAKNISGEYKKSVDEVAKFVTDPVEGFNNVGEELRRWRNSVKNLEPATASEEAWGEAGRFAYLAAAAVMAKRSPTGKPPSNQYKGVLRLFFGELVEKVTIHWGTTPLDEWAADKFNIRLENVDTEAQSFGYDIYVRSAEGKPNKITCLQTIAHELVHTTQFEKYGHSYSNFGYNYFKGYKRANLSYENIPMEKEAYALESKVAQRLRILFMKPGSEQYPRYLQRVKDHAA